MSREGVRHVVVHYIEDWASAHGALPSGTHAIPVRRSRMFSELVQLDFDTLAVDVASSAFGETRQSHMLVVTRPLSSKRATSPMTYDEIRMPSPFDATLPDGTNVRLVPSVIPVFDESLLVHFREVWTVRDAEDLTGTDANWRTPLAVDVTPSLALEEAWIETLIRRGAHYSGGAGLPPVPRFLVMQIERVIGSRVFERAVESRACGTRSEARDGFELLCAEFLAANGYGGEIHLIDRKARHRLATSLPLGISRGGVDPVVADWVLRCSLSIHHSRSNP